jgi:hypothetical protein
MRCAQIYLLGRRVAGETDENGMLCCGGASPLGRESGDLCVVGEVEDVCAPFETGSL